MVSLLLLRSTFLFILLLFGIYSPSKTWNFSMLKNKTLRLLNNFRRYGKAPLWKHFDFFFFIESVIPPSFAPMSSIKLFFVNSSVLFSALLHLNSTVPLSIKLLKHKNIHLNNLRLLHKLMLCRFIKLMDLSSTWTSGSISLAYCKEETCLFPIE